MNENKTPKCRMAADEDEDENKKKRAELTRRLLNGETIAFGEGGKIVDVDSEEAIATIPYGKFGD